MTSTRGNGFAVVLVAVALSCTAPARAIQVRATICEHPFDRQGLDHEALVKKLKAPAGICWNVSEPTVSFDAIDELPSLVPDGPERPRKRARPKSRNSTQASA